ncbi:uncharacterized protein LOC135121997 [Zophobas morio]|uniref:uncharacterized protein LOC135121997 n=1 Tax=Zophobas morio TaxID=2755281 RepID=UPI003083D89A
MAASFEILIADWMLSPEIYLRRGPNASVHDRLDNILQERAHAGVRIYILAWNETKFGLFLKATYSSFDWLNFSQAFKFSNEHAKLTLENLHENIKVIAHPAAVPFEWSHHDKLICIDRTVAFIGGLDLAFGRYDTCKHPLVDDCHLKLVWPGKDYYNPTIKEICRIFMKPRAYHKSRKVDKPFEDLLERTTQPRMPWHDVYCSLWGSEIATDFFLHFAQRWNHHARELHIDEYYPVLCPDGLGSINSVLTENQLSLSSLPIKKFIQTLSHKPLNCEAQFLRSISSWSGGQSTECSILTAMLRTIEDAEHYIYIENQYFISSTLKSRSSDEPRNFIAGAICARVRRAIKENKLFQVFITLPISPEGNFRDDAILRYIMLLQYETIYLSKTSLFQTLKREFPSIDLQQYIKLFSLRTWGLLGKKIVTEMIYVHSKLLIVDDKVTIIGSPNINDRSLLGDGDSEVAIIIRDQDYVTSKMSGVQYSAGRFSHTLRCKLWAEHLGLSSFEGVKDPLAKETLFLLTSTAANNTLIYESLFPDVNSNNILTMHDLLAKMASLGRNYKSYICECNCTNEALSLLKK